MHLHDNKEEFRNLLDRVAHDSGRAGVVIEKDYYVTMILRKLSEAMDNCVFRGGTSLSKGFHIINRFSEDVDIALTEHIGESRRKKLKYNVLKSISETLGLPIKNWDETQSDRDYNAYLFSYMSVYEEADERMPQHVRVEIALGAYAFPIVRVAIGNYIGDYLEKVGRMDIAKQFSLDPFDMNLQSPERTYIDKIFALCDYYMQGRTTRISRHLYDIYRLTPQIQFTEDFWNLFREVRLQREHMPMCTSARSGVNLAEVIDEFCNNDFYKEDYKIVTDYFIEDKAAYEDAVAALRRLAAKWTENVESKLDEADWQAASTEERLSHQEVFDYVKKTLDGK